MPEMATVQSRIHATAKQGNRDFPQASSAGWSHQRAHPLKAYPGPALVDHGPRFLMTRSPIHPLRAPSRTPVVSPVSPQNQSKPCPSARRSECSDSFFSLPQPRNSRTDLISANSHLCLFLADCSSTAPGPSISWARPLHEHRHSSLLNDGDVPAQTDPQRHRGFI